MRQFGLVNSIGEKFMLNGSRGVHMVNPQGLGYSLAPTYSDNYYGFYANTYDKTEPQQEIIGEFLFMDNPYKNYRDFIDWVYSSDKLEFSYQPDENTFYKRVEIKQVEKTEITKYGCLISKITFACLTPWYNPIPSYVRLEKGLPGESLKSYTHTYSYRYNPGTAAGSVEIIGKGHIDSAIKVDIDGPISNPIIELKSRSSSGSLETVGKIKFSTDDTFEVPSGKKLSISTVPGDSYVVLSGEDVINCVDISENVFFRIPKNTTCELSIVSDSTSPVQSVITVYDYYRGV